MTPPIVAGLIDAGRSIGIRRIEEGLEYTPVVKTSLRGDELAKAISNMYDGSYGVDKGIPEKVPEYMYWWIGLGYDAQRILEACITHLILVRRQAELAIQFQALQPKLHKAGNSKSQAGDLAILLAAYGGAYNLVDLLREGFYSEMYRLNHER